MRPIFAAVGSAALTHTGIMAQDQVSAEEIAQNH
jgi:hypothetical protein